MLHTLSSPLHHESLGLPFELDEHWVASHQVVAVLTGGTEALFLRLLQDNQITLDKPIYLIAGGQSNSLAASMEILSYINQHNGHGEIRINRTAE